MEFEIKEIKSRNIWEDFLKEIGEKTFLQSFNWGKFSESMGDKIMRLGLFLGSDLLATALVIIIRAKRGTFLFLPHGPNVKKETDRERVLSCLLGYLKDFCKKRNISFIRIAPVWKRNQNNKELFEKLGFREAPIHIHPDLTWELDLSTSEEELLKNMRKTTRYLIKKASKDEEIKISKSKDFKRVVDFNNLYLTTKKRHHFIPFSLDYLKKELSSFSDDDEILIISGAYKGEIVSSGIFIFWQGICFYHHGASSQKYPKAPVSYLLLWEAIKEAKQRRCERFNFWGIAPILEENCKKHPWAGLTLFKMGFGGRERKYVKTQDFVLSLSYYISFLIDKVRKMKRGL